MTDGESSDNEEMGSIRTRKRGKAANKSKKSKPAKRTPRSKKPSTPDKSDNSKTADVVNSSNDVSMISENETPAKGSRSAKRKSGGQKPRATENLENSVSTPVHRRSNRRKSLAPEELVEDSVPTSVNRRSSRRKSSIPEESASNLKTKTKESKPVRGKSRSKDVSAAEDLENSETEDVSNKDTVSGTDDGENSAMNIEEENDSSPEQVISSAKRTKNTKSGKQKSKGKKATSSEDSQNSKTENSDESVKNDESAKNTANSEPTLSNDTEKSGDQKSSVLEESVDSNEPMNIEDSRNSASAEPVLGNDMENMNKTRTEISVKQMSQGKKSPLDEDPENPEAEQPIASKTAEIAELMNTDDDGDGAETEPASEHDTENSEPTKRVSRGKKSPDPEDPENDEPIDIEDADDEENEKETKTKKSKVKKRKPRGKKTPVPEDSEDSETEEAEKDGENIADERMNVEDGEDGEKAEGATSKSTKKPNSTKTKNLKPTKRKSNGKKSPNPRPKKKPKKTKKQVNHDFLAQLLEYEELPLDAKLILQRNDALEVLTTAEIDTLFGSLTETVKAAAELIYDNLNNVVALNYLKSVSMLMICLVENSPADEPILESISHVATFLGLLQKLEIDLNVKECITEVCGLLLAKNAELSDNVFFLTINSIIDFVLSSTAKSQRSKKFIKLLHTLERVIARLQIMSTACEPLVTKFLSIFKCKELLTVKEGKEFLSFLLTLDIRLLPRFHQAIKDALPLPYIKKVHANGYGDVYYLAWLHSSDNKEMRKAIETKCFQNYMLAIFTIQRTGLEMSSLGHNVFTILSYLHNKREHLGLSKTITALYTPLLWRHLRLENNLIRCNAAEVFFDVYPLEYHGEAKPERIMHLNRQHDEMADLLKDDCHLVRIIAVRGVFSCMKSIWTTFPPESSQKLFKIMIHDLINDGSSSDVRCSVYRGFTSLLDNPQTHEYLASLLPMLRDYLNDECDKVRVSFVKLLQKVKDSNIEDFKYWNISDVKLLTLRLANEKNESVCKALTELIFSNVFSKNNDDGVTIRRLVRLIQMNPLAARKLIQYSAKLLPYEDAYRLMMVILSSLPAHVKVRMDMEAEREERAARAEEDDNHEDMRPKAKKRRKHHRPLSERTNNVDDDDCHDTSSGESNASSVSTKAEESAASSQSEQKLSPFDELPVSHALFDIVCLLWIIHAGTLNSPEKDKDLKDLYTIATVNIGHMLKHFKGTETFFGVLQIASLIPLSKLVSACNIASACISQLKHNAHKLPREECRCIVSSLCSWNRGCDVIELAYDWLNAAFKVENLNYSAFPAKEAARKRVITFETMEAKPTCALNLLDMIFSNPVDKTRVLNKNYDQLMELLTFLERIKVLIEKRLKNEEVFSAEVLSDEFLSRCLLTYLKLAIVLHKESDSNTTTSTVTETFNVKDFYPKILEWCESTLVESLDPRPAPVVCSFINAIVQAGCTMTAINRMDNQIMLRVLRMLTRCLSCGENGILVMENAVQFLSLSMNFAINRYSAKYLRHIYVSTVPHFLKSILSAATYRIYEQETIIDCVEDIVGLKKTIREILQNYITVHAKDKTNSLLPRIIKIVTKAIVQSYTAEVLKHNVAITTAKLNNLPFFANFLLSCINSRPVLCSIFLTCLNREVSEKYLNNGAQLLATVSLLYTLAMNKFKFKPAEFSATVKLTNDVLMKYRAPPDDAQLNESGLSGFIDRAHNLDEQDVQLQGAQLIQQISEKIGFLV